MERQRAEGGETPDEMDKGNITDHMVEKRGVSHGKIKKEGILSCLGKRSVSF